MSLISPVILATIFETFILLTLLFFIAKRPLIFAPLITILIAFGANKLFNIYAIGPYAVGDGAKIVGKAYMTGVVYKPEVGFEEHYGVVMDDKVPVPKYSDNQALIKIKAAGLNPSNYKVNFGLIPFVRWFRKHVSGYDFAGEVIAVGKSEECKHLKAGDEVFGMTFGSFAEYAVAFCDWTVHKPHKMSFEQIASTPVTALTTIEAYDRAGLTKADPTNKEKVVLIVGGSGGCGVYGIQLGKIYNFKEVISINSKKNDKIVKKLGATKTVDYTNEKELKSFIDEYKGKVDFVYDTVSSFDEVDMQYYPILKDVLKSGDEPMYIQINGNFLKEFIPGALDTALGEAQASLGIDKTKRFSIQKKNFDLFLLSPSRDKLERLKEMFDSKELDKDMVLIDEEFKLDSNASLWKAFKKMESRRTVGKLIVKI